MSAVGSVGHCVWCNDAVYGVHADQDPPAHPCCAWWMGAMGEKRCVGCAESRRLRREHHRRFHTSPRRPDPKCELCAIPAQGRPGAPPGPSGGSQYPAERTGPYSGSPAGGRRAS